MTRRHNTHLLNEGLLGLERDLHANGAATRTHRRLSQIESHGQQRRHTKADGREPAERVQQTKARRETRVAQHRRQQNPWAAHAGQAKFANQSKLQDEKHAKLEQADAPELLVDAVDQALRLLDDVLRGLVAAQQETR